MAFWMVFDGVSMFFHLFSSVFLHALRLKAAGTDGDRAHGGRRSTGRSSGTCHFRGARAFGRWRGGGEVFSALGPLNLGFCGVSKRIARHTTPKA